MVIGARLVGLSLAALIVSSAAAAGEDAHMVVRLYDTGRLPAPVVSAAAEQADRIFRHAGIAVEWVICIGPRQVADSRCAEDSSALVLMVRLQDGVSPAGTAVCGTAMRAPDAVVGQFVSLFVPCIRGLADRAVVTEATVLAYCLAHELGHQLLPTATHAPDGLMAASLSAMDWRRAAAGRLWFSRKEAELLHAGVASRAHASAAAGPER